MLKARKVTYERKPRAGKLTAGSGGGVAATDAEPLATLPSPTIATLIAQTNIPSENFYAQMLIKALGAHFGAGGTTTAGLAVTRAQLATFGIHPKLADGSGLSRINHTTTREVVRAPIVRGAEAARAEAAGAVPSAVAPRRS